MSAIEQLGKYEYDKATMLGHGAFAVVYKGWEIGRQSKQVAVKSITKKNLPKSKGFLDKEIAVFRQLTELQHENVVALLQCIETESQVHLIMEFCNGGDLAGYIETKGTLSEDTIYLFLRQIAAAMHTMHTKGVVHRDLKPHNILLSHNPNMKHPQPQDFKLKIADFGFARFLNAGVMAATLCGSPQYMAPEVIMSLQYDAKADLWSAGTIVYQCLTGKAPFQAQTPQQLKSYYEKHAALQPHMPSGTSPELRDLLLRTLKRNAKERITFEDFFKHPFLQQRSSKSSSPMTVPRSRSRNSSTGSPPIKHVNASPLSGMIPLSPSNPTLQRVRDQAPLDSGSPPDSAMGGYLKPVPRCSPPIHEDFVMVPENIPSDHSASSITSHRRNSVDLNAIFSDNSQDSIRYHAAVSRPSSASKNKRRSLPGGMSIPQVQGLSPGHDLSPSRPSTLPVNTPPSRYGSSEAMSMPRQMKGYEQRSSSQSSLNRSPGYTASPKGESDVGSNVGVSIPRKASTGSITSISSLSPPTVQFTIGTPPSANPQWKRSTSPNPAVCYNANIVRAGSPRSNMQKNFNSGTPPRVNTTMTAPSSLPTIVGSPTKLYPSQPRGNPTNVPPSQGFVFHPSTGVNSPTDPLRAAFGVNLLSQQNNNLTETNGSDAAVNNNTIVDDAMERSHTDPGSLLKSPMSTDLISPLTSRLSEQLLRAAFTSPTVVSPQSVLQFSPGSTPPSDLHSISPTSLKNRTTLYKEHGSSPYDRRSSLNSTSPRNVNKSTSGSMPMFINSPTNMEGPISFVGPELVEETLMNREHNETLSKLNFVLGLVECIVELANSRSSALSESCYDMKSPNNQGTFTLDHMTFISESQRRLEQLVLYVRALQLLSASMQLARQEASAGRLHGSTTVKNLLQEMNVYYRKCLRLCKQLHKGGMIRMNEMSPEDASITADKLIYSYAIEQCQTGILDEWFGNSDKCFRRYCNAQILLHSLAQQAQHSEDRILINNYKRSVEQRLYRLKERDEAKVYSN